MSDRWSTLLTELIRIPSTSGEEFAIVERVASVIREIGCRPYFIPHDEIRNSIAVRIPGKGRGRSIVLSSHLDTVSAGDPNAWAHPPCSGFVDESNIIHGRGSMDDKAGVAIALAVMERVAKREELLDGDVLFHFVIDDETTGDGSMHCLEAGFTSDAACIIDGTRLDCAIDRHAGQLQFDVHVKGRPASVSVSHMGVNAAEILAELTGALKIAVHRLNDERESPWNMFPSPFQLVTQRLASQSEQLTVPDRAEASYWMTFPPPYTLEKARSLLRITAAAIAATHTLHDAIAFAWGPFQTEPVESGESALHNVIAATAEKLGMSPIATGPSTGTSDMRHFVEHGIPCVLYGPGTGFNPHRADERYHLDDLPIMITFYEELVRKWCSSS